MPRLFGTDGVRGVAAEFLTTELALGLGRAVAALAPVQRPRVIIVRDPRESGAMLEAALAAGVAAGGGDALLGGVLPTPAAPLLLRRYGFDLAAVISASHNPFTDNGIKFFGPDGGKLSDEQEDRIERSLRDPPAVPVAIGTIRRLHGTLEDYLRELHVRFEGLDLADRRVLLDCANGATFRAAPEIFRRMGATVATRADRPDGRNINEGCGSTHVEALAAAVVAGGHDVGFAFDGDGDRVLAVDRLGTVVDGDELIALAARHLKATGRLRGGGVAVTVMTNFGFHAAMEQAGITVAQTSVGDRHVLGALRERGWSLGGEQSGHIIDLGFAPSGDGIAGALLCLEALDGRDLVQRDGMRKLPQRLVSVAVGDREALDGAVLVHEAIAREDAALAGRGRVLVRRSGTEPVVRVMVEAPTAGEADAIIQRLVEVVRAQIG